MDGLDASVAARLHANTDYGDGEGCWLWTGYSISGGYGRMMVGRTPRLAHRVAYELSDCPIPDGHCILHICDVPACVRPTHLRLGTQLDNIRDRDIKRRQVRGDRASVPRRGEKNGMAKLSSSDVREIRRLCITRTRREVAEEFGISRQQAGDIANRKFWKHIEDD